MDYNTCSPDPSIPTPNNNHWHQMIILVIVEMTIQYMEKEKRLTMMTSLTLGSVEANMGVLKLNKVFLQGGWICMANGLMNSGLI